MMHEVGLLKSFFSFLLLLICCAEYFSLGKTEKFILLEEKF